MTTNASLCIIGLFKVQCKASLCSPFHTQQSNPACFRNYSGKLKQCKQGINTNDIDMARVLPSHHITSNYFHCQLIALPKPQGIGPGTAMTLSACLIACLSVCLSTKYEFQSWIQKYMQWFCGKDFPHPLFSLISSNLQDWLSWYAISYYCKIIIFVILFSHPHALGARGILSPEQSFEKARGHRAILQ